jgi:hypothetical protein
MNGFKLRIMLICTVWATSSAIAQVFLPTRLPDAHVVVQVSDENGNRVPDANVRIGGTISPNANPATVARGLTDAGGAVDIHLKSNGEIHVTAGRAGYYRTQISPAYNYRDAATAIETAFVRGKWQPDPITIEVLLKNC